MWDWIFAYGTLFVGTAFAAAALAKDAEDYVNLSKSSGRLLLFVLYALCLFLLAGGIYQTHQTRSRANADREQASKDRRQLEQDRAEAKTFKAANDARLSDANASLQRLQDKVDKLQTQAQTQELSRELSDVTAELEDAKSKLRQPRAKFVATIATPNYDKIPVLETVGERTPEGIKVDFGVVNSGEVAATKGEIVIRLCAICQFAFEPPLFFKPNIGPDGERVRMFDNIQEHAVVQDMSVTIVPPLGDPPNFMIAVMVKCESCEPGRFTQLRVDIPPLVSPDFRSNKKKTSAKRHQ